VVGGLLEVASRVRTPRIAEGTRLVDEDEDEEGVISMMGISPHLAGDEVVVEVAVDLNYVLMLPFLGFYIRKGRTCDLSCLYHRCIQEHSSRRKRRSYNRSSKKSVCDFYSNHSSCFFS
jgi:hypothetical protein